MRPTGRWAKGGFLLAVLVVTAGTNAVAGPETHQAATPTAAAPEASGSWAGAPDGDAPCPEGMTRSNTLQTQHFEGGIPQGQFNNGWYRSTGGLGPGFSAGSGVPADGSDTKDYFFLDWAISTPGTTTMLGYATRGSTRGGYYATVNVNSQHFEVPVSRNWEGVVHDVTPATRDEGGRLGTWFEHRARSGEAARWYLDNLQIFTCRAVNVARVSGTTRYETAVELSQQHQPGVATAYVARGDFYADAAGGAALAGHREGPVLLVEPDSIPDSVEAELGRLQPGRIVVFGGTSAVSDSVLDQLRSYATSNGGDAVRRLSGPNRYATSAAISEEYAPGAERVYVATGEGFPDALTGGVLAAQHGSPILFTEPTELRDEVVPALQRLEPERIVVLGGEAAVGDTVEQALAQYASTGQVSRIAGTDRYDTSARIAARLPQTSNRVYLATGEDFPDALAGSAYAAWRDSPVLLTRPETIPPPVRSRLSALAPSRGVVLGGSGAVYSIVMDQLGRFVD